MRVRWMMAALALGLAACEEPDPLAQARADCAGGELDAAARAAACSTLIDSGALDDAERAAALAHRGDAQFSAGDPTAALRDFNTALGLNPEETGAKLGRARVLVESGQLDAAASLVASLIEANALPGPAHYLRGRIYAAHSDIGGAITEFNAALDADPRMADALAHRGLAKQRNEDLTGARDDFNAAIRVDSAQPVARAGRCWNRLQQSGESNDGVGDARADAEAAIAADPALMDARLCLALALLKQEQWGPARAAYEDALRLEPANAAALFGRGVASRNDGARDAGDDDVDRAYEFNSQVDREFRRFGVRL